MSDYTPVASMSTNAPEDDQISLLDLLIVVARRKRLLFGLPIMVGLIAAAYSLSLPNIYTAVTRILPPQQTGSSAAALLGQLGGLPGVGGLTGLKNPNDLYIGMLKSRSVADRLIERFHLMERYEVTRPSDARKTLAAVTVIAAGKDGIVALEVDSENPKMAADMANAYIEELLKLTQVLAVTEASQRRLFFEKQFNLARDRLAAAESASRAALGSNGLVQVEGQGRSCVETAARLRAQVTAKEVQLGAMRSFASGQNPDLVLAERELDSLRTQLARLEGGGSDRTDRSTAGVSGAGGNQSLALLREVKYQETLYELLAKQLELARLDEAKESSVVQVMDRAIEPDRKSKPVRSKIVLLSVVAAFFATLLWIFMSEAIARSARDNPDTRRRLDELKRALRLRSPK